MLIAAIALAGLTSCSDSEGIESLGRPTTIDPGRTPVAVICDIQQEFRALPKPVLADIEYVRETSRGMSVEFQFRHREPLPAYYQYQLTEPARFWVKTHTSAELSVALMPLVLDPDYGGEAAVTLTALATGRKFRINQYGYHNSSIAADVSRFMHATGYRSPTDRGHWDFELARQFQVPNQVTLVFEGRSFSHDEDSEFNRLALSTETLNHKLKQIQGQLFYYENGLSPNRVYGYDAFETVETLDDWIPANGLPEPPRKEMLDELVASWSDEFIVLAAYPNGIPSGIGVYVLGLQRYWPVLFNYQHTVLETYRYKTLPKFDEYREMYSRELTDKVREMAATACSKAVDVRS